MPIEDDCHALYLAHEEMGHFESGTMMAEAYKYLCRALVYAKHDQFMRAAQFASIASAIIQLDRCEQTRLHMTGLE